MTKEERKALNLKRYAVYEQYRVKLGFTDHYISSELNIPKSTIYDWKSGISCPKADTLLKICDFLHMPITEVVGNTDG